jgi:hypothetical protein
MTIMNVLNKPMKKNVHTSERGIALLITLLLITVLLGVSSSLLNITLKQFQFASIGLASEMSFQAANAGMECILAHDYLDQDLSTPNSLESKFDIGQSRPNISCMGVSSPGSGPVVVSGSEQAYEFSWDDAMVTNTPSLCTRVSIFKFYEDPAADGNTQGPDMNAALRRSGFCAEGVNCTVVQSRGYNVACASINNPRTIERELTQRY